MALVVVERYSDFASLDGREGPQPIFLLWLSGLSCFEVGFELGIDVDELGRRKGRGYVGRDGQRVWGTGG